MKTIKKAPALIPLPDELHKGTAGRVLCIGGSLGLSGSILLSAKAALRTGAGLVTIAVPKAIGDIVETASLETMTLYCESNKGHFAKKAWSTLSIQIAKTDSIVFGPGIGRNKEIKSLLQKTLSKNKKIVIDADGLHAFKKLKFKATQPVILTPHIGEMAMLLGKNISDIHSERLKLATSYALQNNVILVLKSHRTIVTDGLQVYEEKAGNPGMATGGSGDVLAGTIASFLLMSDKSPFLNTIRAVHAHSLSADLATKNKSQRSLIASDIIENYGAILKSLEKNH